MDKLKTLEQTKQFLEFPESFISLSHKDRRELDQWHLGQVNDLSNIDYDSEFVKILEYMFENMPPLKLCKWSDLEPLRRSGELLGWQGLRFQANSYHRFLPEIYTSGSINEHGAPSTKFAVSEPLTDKVVDIKDYAGEELVSGDFDAEDFPVSLNSMYYHSAKAHWLTQSIIEEGLWAPIQGITQSTGNKVQLMIHPGSVRSGCFEEMEDPNHELLIWDTHDIIPSEPITVKQCLEYWKDKVTNGVRKPKYKGLSAIWTNGTIEFQADFSNVDFRKYVWEHSEKVTKLSKGKPLNVYIGYDSRHNSLEEVCKESLLQSIKKSIGGGRFVNYNEFTPEIKFLDVSKIPEYTRPYENQSTWFTYSRFLIPYLENYEGFSMFIDDDFIFNKSILPMFYYLNPDDAVACIKYPQIKHDETKFDGEVNIDYPCKLWSSMMFFNNGHEDCKKLTPEVVNTWTGAQLHQFEWTDKISAIPEKYIFVEGYDDPDVKWDYTGIHYTRGGPWIDDMDSSHINNLEDFEKFKNTIVK